MWANGPASAGYAPRPSRGSDTCNPEYSAIRYCEMSLRSFYTGSYPQKSLQSSYMGLFSRRQGLEGDHYQNQRGHRVCTPTIGATLHPYGWPTVGNSELRQALGVATCPVLSLSNLLDHTGTILIILSNFSNYRNFLEQLK